MKSFGKTAALAAGLLMAQTALALDITGAGATFPAPVYAKWADAYQKETGNRINYQSLGSSGGIKQIQAKTVDFGASDAPMKDADLEKNGLVQFPTVIGGVVPVINLPGIKPGELVLTGEVLGDIFLGKITQWSDPAILALNPTAKLPNQDILVVRRADGSGTSFIFTNYLSKVNGEWRDRVGEGTTVNWPTGTGGKGNEGVSAFVQRLNGAIGYVEYAYAKQNKMTHINLKNAAGAVVAPSEASFKAAAAGADWSSSYYQILTDQPGDASWPIAGATFILMHRTPEKTEEAAQTLRFFDWAYTKGAEQAVSLDYVPMPDNVIVQIRATWKASITDKAGEPLYR